MKVWICRYLLFCASLGLSGCAYHMGSVGRSIPGGYKQVTIPIFKNKSQETGVEVVYTNSLMQEFLRSKVVKIVDENLSEVRIEGIITDINYVPGSRKTFGDGSAPFLSRGAVIATEYRILVSVSVRIVRQADGLELWSGTFTGERTYTAPQVTLTGVNTVNPLYNLSARRQNIDLMAADMMAEAHDRITENF